MIRLRFFALSPLFLLFLTICPSLRAQTAAPEQSGPYSTLLIRNVTVIDGSGAPAYGPVNILVKNDHIDQITPIDAIARGRASQNSAELKADREIDGTGMYVVPGLIDCHIHVNSSKDVPAEYIYKLLLGSGVTTIRVFNIGNDDPAAMMAEKRRSAANQIIAPRIYVYPFWGRGKDPRWTSPTGAREIVREWHALGVDGVKVIGKPGLWPDVFHAIADEARANNMGVAVHIAQDSVYPMNAVRVAAEGASTIEHHYGYPESSFTTHTIQELPPDYNYSSEPDRFLETGRAWLQADLKRLHGEVIDSLLDSMHKTGFIMDPTFDIYEANRDLERAENLPWHNDYTLPVVMDSFRPNPAHHASYFYEWTSNKEADWAQAYRRWMEFVNDYKNRGGIVSVGSDTGFLFELWGFGTIRELELLEEAGFTPLETIHSATENGARVVRNPQLGVLRPGYLADMVVLSENPLADMKVFYGNGITRVGTDRKAHHEQCVRYTIKAGVVYDSQALLSDVREMVAKAKAAH
ncbi:MAG TPA: amidohydrolase family protein [Terriglobales bacterium]|nr:amidohydrolase family protein [Terriglobales bacterium]